MIITLQSGCELEPSEAPHEPDRLQSLSPSGEELPGQRLAWEVLRARFEEHEGLDVGDTEPAIWWISEQCPDRPDINAVIVDGECWGGYSWSCAEIYVATYAKRPNYICGTKLFHELGHCLLDLAVGDMDPEHRRRDLWESLIPTAAGEICAIVRDL